MGNRHDLERKLGKMLKYSKPHRRKLLVVKKIPFKNLHRKQGHSCTSPRNLCQAKTEAMKLIGRDHYIIQYIKSEQKLPSLKHLREKVPKTEKERKIVADFLKTKQIEAKTSSFENLAKTENSRSELLNKSTHKMNMGYNYEEEHYGDAKHLANRRRLPHLAKHGSMVEDIPVKIQRSKDDDVTSSLLMDCADIVNKSDHLLRQTFWGKKNKAAEEAAIELLGGDIVNFKGNFEAWSIHRGNIPLITTHSQKRHKNR